MIKRARPLSALRRGLLVAAALLTIPVAGLYAQTTGRLFGQLTDAQGASLPGVTVSVSSPSMQGTQTQVTDGEGNYRFPSLPPGHYTVKAELASFKTIEQPVDIGLDRTVTLESQDADRRRHRNGHGPGDVAGGRHDLDDTGVSVTPEMFNKLPVRRDFYALTTHGARRDVRHGRTDRLRIVERGEPVHHRRSEHDRRRARRQGQDAELRLHAGSRSEDRRPARRVRPHDRRRRSTC